MVNQVRQLHKIIGRGVGEPYLSFFFVLFVSCAAVGDLPSSGGPAYDVVVRHPGFSCITWSQGRLDRSRGT